jgi:hypothetical protein
VLSLGVGAVLLLAFVLWELRTDVPMLPMRFFRIRAFAAANVASLLMFFGMFGSIFLLASSSRRCRGTRLSARVSGSCRGRRCPSSSRRLPAPCPEDRRAAADGDRPRPAGPSGSAGSRR